MKAKTAIVQSVFDFAVREINALEGRIVQAEDDADAMLWEQAAQVVAQLEAGLTQRRLAAQWISARTGEPYSQMHVSYTRQVIEKFTFQDPRPRFRDAYNEVANQTPPGAHVSHNSGNNEWYTPAPFIEAARAVLGAIDLDPASSARANEIVRAAQFYNASDDGLTREWHGRIWMNPPYAQPLIEHFAGRFAGAVEGGDVTAGIALVNNATDTAWFAMLAGVATALCFPTGRVRFWNPESEDTAAPLQGQAVIYAGPDQAAFVREFHAFGTVLLKARP